MPPAISPDSSRSKWRKAGKKPFTGCTPRPTAPPSRSPSASPPPPPASPLPPPTASSSAGRTGLQTCPSVAQALACTPLLRQRSPQQGQHRDILLPTDFFLDRDKGFEIQCLDLRSIDKV